jgi:uncharacterized protein (TIGR02646 family)
MKFISKRNQQDDLVQFKDDMRDDPNLGYAHPSFPRLPVIASLLGDQGNLCAYTMQRIGVESCHIEHFKPQCDCRSDDKKLTDNGFEPLHEDIAWHNLFACYPKPPRRGEHEPGYGAIQRKCTKLDVSPLDPICESVFKFSYDGTITSAVQTATDTIKTLNLKHESLREQREAKIKEIGLHPRSEDPLSIEEAQELLAGRWKERLPEGFMEFCVALRDAAQEYIISVENQFEKAAQNAE